MSKLQINLYEDYLNKLSQLHSKKEKLFDEGKFKFWDIDPEELKITEIDKIKCNKSLAMKLILSKVNNNAI